MLHLILTASTDDARSHTHFVLRRIHEDGSESTLEASGAVLPLVNVGLFGTERAALLSAAIHALQTELEKTVDTHR